MDYDDNDFASQTSQLVGDEDNKFPTGLHSYALPKFDLDEHLQVHLRFDSLGEAGLLPDIPSETEDRWIEDYSREATNILELEPVSHGVDFGVNAEESCNISRNNNVWSEAASSKSVEMLLNSVGQDEMNTDNHNIARSDDSDALDKAGEQMNSGFCHGDSPHDEKIDPFMDTVVTPDNPQGNSPSLEKDAPEHISHVESMPDLQGSKNMVSNDLHKSETGMPNSSPKRTSVEVKSSDGNEFELLSTNREFANEVVHTKYLDPLQAESMFPSEDSLHYKSVVIDELHSISAVANEVIAEKLVISPKVPPVSPTTQSETAEIDVPIGDACNKVFSEGLQGTDITFNANVDDENVSCEDPNVNYHLMDNEFVHKNSCILGETHLVEEKAVVLMDSILVQKKLTLNDASEGVQDCLKSFDICCTEIPKANTQAVGQHLDSTLLQADVSEVQNTSEGSLNHSPTSSNVENQVGGVQSPVSGSRSASQSNVAAAHADMDRVSPEDLAKKDTSIAVPEDLAKKAAIQHDLVVPGTQTTENVVCETTSSAGKTVVLHQFDPGRVEVVSCNISDIAFAGVSEGSVSVMVVNGNSMKCEDLQHKDGTSLVVTSGETEHREQIDGECQVANVANLSACEAGHLRDTDGTDLPATESGSLTESSDKNKKVEANEILSEETPHDHSAMVNITDSPVDSKATSEPSIMSSEENPCECPRRTDTETFSFASSTTDALKSSTVDSKVSSDVVKDIAVSILVDASKPAGGVVYGRDSLNNDADTSKTGSDIASYAEPDCGSPTIISCSEPCIGEGKYEGAKGSTVASPASGDVSCSPLDISGHFDKQLGTEQNLGGIDMPESDKSFTFEVGKVAGSCMDEKIAKGWKSFPSVKPVEIFQINDKESEGETSKASQSPKAQGELEVLKDQSRGKNKSRSGTSGTVRVTAAKGKSTKEPSSAKSTSSPLSDDEHLANAVSPGSPLVSSLLQVKEIKKMAHVEGSATKSLSVATAQMPNLTNVNALATPVPAVFQKLFTDMQQLQLRAQIFVYGSLMQGTAPDEACMASAFGEPVRDGGRSTWESIWRLSVERAQNQKSWVTNPEISPLSFSGMRSSDKAFWGNSVQSRLPATSVCKTSANGSSAPSPAVPSASPLWSMSTPSRDVQHASSVMRSSLIDTHTNLTPVQVYPFPTVRSFGGHNSPWSSHVSGPVPWVLSTQMPGMDAGSSYSTLSKQELGRETPDQDQSVLVSAIHSSSQTVASSPAVSSGLVPSNIHTDSRTTPAAVRQPSAEQKSRKRKKSMSQESNQTLCIQPTPAKSASPAIISKNTPPCNHLIPPTTMPFSSAVSACEVAVVDPTLTKPPMASLTARQMISVGNSERGLIILEETCSQIDQAKLQAEDASAIASSSLRNSQEMWSRLAAQKNSCLDVDIEQRLASAAVTVAAAASVAKAAAAAAKVASEAALQAKLMVDEALSTNKVVTVSQGIETNIAGGGKSSGEFVLTPALKRKENQGVSASFIEFAKEAARKRVEAASAATKRAQNLDAVVKAAELVAEAVSQATVIIGMGDPIPLTLNELLEAGPESYWRHQETSSLCTMRKKTADVALTSSKDSGNANDLYEKALSIEDVTRSYGGRNDYHSVIQSVDNRTKPVNDTQNSLPINELMETQKQQEKPSGVSNSATTLRSGSIYPLELESINLSNPVQSGNHENHGHRSASTVNSIEPESVVEVISEENDLRSVWFSATVLEIKDGSAYVCYKDILSAEGTGQRKEWIPLGASNGKPPRIRIPHRMTGVKFEGTRKRRRSMSNCNWSSGDHVDVWIRDGWWEGVITDKNIEDETKLTVCFPVKGDIRTVRSWNLRPSLVWKDDQWVEWSREKGGWVNEGDTLRDKRQKLDGNLEYDASFNREENNLSNTTCSDGLTKLQESIPLDLQAKDKIFSVGKSGEEDNNLAVRRVKRTGIQTGGSRVVFGVPKPGKKRKFMDVSKHYDGPRTGKGSEVSSEPKFAKYLMSTRSSGLRGPSRGDVKGNELRNAQSRDVKELKPQGRHGRGRFEKVSSTPVGAELPGVQPSLRHGSQPGKPNRMESSSEVPKFASISGPLSSIEEGSVLLLTQRNKPATTDHRQAPRGRIGSANRNVSSDEKSSAVNAQVKRFDSVEPRRSNRRIQPTSRLLEGIQSSLAIGKVSSGGLHEKGGKSSNKNR